MLWILSLLGILVFSLLTFKKVFLPMRRGLQVLSLCLIFALPASILFRKVEKVYLRHQIQKVSHLTIEGEENFIDIEKQTRYRHRLKGPKREKEVKDHLRLAELRLRHPKLSDSFQKIIDHPPKWMVDQIEKELSYFKEHPPMSVSELMTHLKKHPNWQEALLIVRYKIVEGRIYVKDHAKNHNTLQYMNGALIRLSKSVTLPDMEFVISFHDSLDWKDLPAPIFVHCKREGNPFMIVTPDHEILTGYDTLDQKIDRAVESSPWEEKEDIAFWRGGTTGGDYSRPRWRTYPRSRLVCLSRGSDAIDAKFTLYIQGGESNSELLADTDLRGPFIYPEDSLSYRYLIDIDGNASTYSRYYWILRSNCVPLKQMSSFQMWFYRALTPYEHFIPYADDISDLPEKIAWAKDHPQKAKEIADASRTFVLENLTTEHAYAYLYLTLLEYAKLL